MKKIIALIMALVMVMGLAITASAADSETDPGSITITNATIGKTYNLYKILGATVNDNGGVSYFFEDNEWITILTGKYFEAKEPELAIHTPVTYIEDGIEKIGCLKISESNVEDLRDELASPVKTPTLPGLTATETATSTTVVFDDLAPGYYVIVGMTGEVVDSLATIDTVGKDNVEVIDKNQDGASNVDKIPYKNEEAVEDDVLSFTVGDRIPHELTAKVTAYKEDDPVDAYVIEDSGDAAVNLDLNTVKVYVKPQGGDEIELSAADYTLTTTGEAPIVQDMKITIPWSVEKYGVTSEIRVTYEMNTDELDWGGNTNNLSVSAVCGDAVWNGGSDTVTYYTYNFKLKKTDGENLLDNAIFCLTTARIDNIATNTDLTNYIAFGKRNNTYTALQNIMTGKDDAIKITAGDVTINGLGAGTYYLYELEAPAGYNKIVEPIVIEITDAFDDGTPTTPTWKITYPDGTTATVTTDTAETQVATVTVVNNTGSELPSTGGIGTTLFYVIGGLMMTGAAVLLITKKRMSV